VSADGLRADPRLRRAYDLLRSLFEGTGGQPGQAGAGEDSVGPWRSGPESLEDDPWLASATDLLLPWAPDTFAGAAVGPVAAGAGFPAAASHPEAWDAYLAPAAAGHPIPPARPRISLEEPLDDSAAFAAAECLYELVHALGRLDAEAAMAVVADDYCSIDADREVDKGALRHQLEALVDELRGGEVAVALAQVPEPIPYRDGLVLIATTLQVDRRPPGGALPESRLFEWVVVLEETAAGFRIAALAPRSERPSDPLPAPAPSASPFAAAGIERG
jgi:hypothetical protein